MTTTTVRRLPAPVSTWEREADVVVLGAGAAGCSAAVTAAAGGRRVLLLCKGALGSGATAWAQGGLAAVVDDAGDSFELHVRDTLAAGAGLGRPEAVRGLVAAAPLEIARLRRLGAVFDVEPGGSRGPRTRLALTREGGHSRDRVVHAGGDASGAEVDRTLVAALRASSVDVLEHVTALDVLLDGTGRAVGVTAGQIGSGGRLRPGVVSARAVVLATGGCGQAWSSTTNPPGATGDGLALALRAGAELSDLEFLQFHPTVLWTGEAARGQQLLVTEALRGAGAVLVDALGTRVLAGRHPLADLAPRDVVATAMHERMGQAPGGVATHLFLDATRLGRSLLERRFPTVMAGCREAGVDPATEPIPVAPGAHYACGGVRADLSGRTSVPGLFAVGEVACTGIHGANRLASNSVTEALVTGRGAGQLLAESLPAGGEPVAARTGVGVAAATRAGTAAATSRGLGVLRSAPEMQHLLEYVATVPAASSPELDLGTVEATALHTVSTLVAVAASTRTESRGCHRRSDVPGPLSKWERHLTLRLEGDSVCAYPGRRAAAAA